MSGKVLSQAAGMQWQLRDSTEAQVPWIRTKCRKTDLRMLLEPEPRHLSEMCPQLGQRAGGMNTITTDGNGIWWNLTPPTARLWMRCLE